jgi:hypothetical protein
MFEPRLHLRDIAGPLACGEGTSVGKECGLEFAKLASDLGLGTPGLGADAGAGALMRAPKVDDDPAATRSRGAWIAALIAVFAAVVVLVRSRSQRK